MNEEILKLAAEFNDLHRHKQQINEKLNRFWELVAQYNVDVIWSQKPDGSGEKFYLEKWTDDGKFTSKNYTDIYQAVRDLFLDSVDWKQEKI